MSTTGTYFGMDYETASEADLEVVGLANYLDHPSTRILMCAFAEGDGKPKLWEPHRNPKPPAELVEAIEDPFVIINGWNVAFERLVTRKLLKLDKPVSEFRCTMIKSRYLSLPGKLEAAGEVLGLGEDEAKIKDGSRLISKFCSPSVSAQEGGLFGQTPAGFKDWSTDPEDWEKFGIYCKRDVTSERTIGKKLDKFPLPDHEWETWFLDQKVNSVGWPVDMSLVRGAGVIIERDVERLTKRLRELTGLDNPGSVPKMLEWLRSQNYLFSGLNKTFVERALAGECDLTEEAKEALIIRKQTAKSSIKKYGVITHTVSSDGRLRHQYSFLGAARTGRWAAHGANVGNLPKPEKNVEKRLELAVDLVQKMDYEGLIREFKNPLDVVSSTIRPSFAAPKGFKFVVCDLAAIENIMLSYICRCNAIRQVFVDGRDPYIDFATRMYNQTYEELWAEYQAGDKTKRTIAKPATLACFGSDTKVLTSRGWVPIIQVQKTDTLWDGVEWVDHGGVIEKGTKEVIDLSGVQVTPDHKILTKEGWKEACLLNQNTLYERQAIALATGLLSDLTTRSMTKDTTQLTTCVAAKDADQKRLSTEPIWNLEKHTVAILAPETNDTKNSKVSSTSSGMSILTPLTSSVTVTTPFCLDAEEREPLVTDTKDAVLPANLRTSMTLWGIASPSLDSLTTQTKSTVKITMETMRGEISALFPLGSTTATKKTYASLNTKEDVCQPLSSGNSIAPNTETNQRSAGRSTRGIQPSKSFPTNQNARVNTFDVLNAGPRNRFMILTNNGPMLAHNCGYAMGPGEEGIGDDGQKYWTGLMKYSRDMKIEMSQEDAIRSVKIFRQSYPEVTRSWKDFERAAIRAIRHPGEVVGVGVPQSDRDREYFISKSRDPNVEPIISFRCTSNKVLEMMLPSGRSLHYVDPRVDDVEAVWEGETYNKQVISYYGKEQNKQVWGRVKTSGGKILENADQSIARDILVAGMKEADARGFQICGHTYDEIIALVPVNGHLGEHEMEKCMTKIPWWCDPTLPLRAEAYCDTIYRKN